MTTVGELKEHLEQFDDENYVYAYEGEAPHGLIIVSHDERDEMGYLETVGFIGADNRDVPGKEEA